MDDKAFDDAIHSFIDKKVTIDATMVEFRKMLTIMDESFQDFSMDDSLLMKEILEHLVDDGEKDEKALLIQDIKTLLLEFLVEHQRQQQPMLFR